LYPLAVRRNSLGVAETPAEYVFHRPRLYLETTIPSYLAARPSRNLTTARLQRITTRWWNSWRTQFHIHVSTLVKTEAAAGDSEAARRRLNIIEPYLPLEETDSVKTLYQQFVRRSALPSRADDDALHLALATVYGMEFLLSWNCAHLVNPRFSKQIATICQSEGFSCPIICTPEQLLESTKILLPDEDCEILMEVRRMREEVRARFGHDPNRLFEYLKQCAAERRNKQAAGTPGWPGPDIAHPPEKAGEE
jgi:hypothetical protein